MSRLTLVSILVGAAMLLGLFAAIIAASLAVPEGSPTVQVPESSTIGAGVDLPIVQLDGSWASTPDVNDSQYFATVSNGQIEIKMANDDLSMLYWVGTFESSASAGETVASNKVEVDKMVLSGADAKDFVVGEDAITFTFEAMGMQRTVALHRA